MIKKKVIALMVTGGMLASIGLSASAFTKTTTGSAVTKTTQAQTQTLSKFQRENGQKDIKTQLDALVKSGKITQAIEDKVVAYLAKVDTGRQAEMDKVKAMTEAERQTYFSSNTKTAKTDIFKDLVKSNTLTQSEADTLKAACPQLQMGNMGGKGHDRGQGQNHDGIYDVDRQAQMKTQLDALVKAGTITQATEDKVIAYQSKIATDRQAEMDKVNAMTETQRKAYFDSKTKTEITDMFTDLVKSNVLTQSEADALKAALPQTQKGDIDKGQGRGRGHDGANDADRQAEMKTKLDALVKAGTITQATEDKVIAYQSKIAADRQAEMTKVNAMTDTQRKAYFDSKTKTERPDQLTEMVKAGTLTQSEADSLKTLFQHK
jgi:predicted transcriptional regulator